MKRLEVKLDGCNRITVLTKRYAIKIPNIRSYTQTLWGLLDNTNEVKCRKLEGVCPVIFWLPLGILNVMPRCTPISDDQFSSLNYEAYRMRGVTVEYKRCSFGLLNGRIVAVDYGVF